MSNKLYYLMPTSKKVRTKSLPGYPSLKDAVYHILEILASDIPSLLVTSITNSNQINVTVDKKDEDSIDRINAALYRNTYFYGYLTSTNGFDNLSLIKGRRRIPLEFLPLEPPSDNVTLNQLFNFRISVRNNDDVSFDLNQLPQFNEMAKQTPILPYYNNSKKLDDDTIAESLELANKLTNTNLLAQLSDQPNYKDEFATIQMVRNSPLGGLKYLFGLGSSNYVEILPEIIIPSTLGGFLVAYKDAKTGQISHVEHLNEDKELIQDITFFDSGKDVDLSGNGLTVEDLLSLAYTQLRIKNANIPSEENVAAFKHIEAAIALLMLRQVTKDL